MGLSDLRTARDAGGQLCGEHVRMSFLNKMVMNNHGIGARTQALAGHCCVARIREAGNVLGRRAAADRAMMRQIRAVQGEIKRLFAKFDSKSKPGRWLRLHGRIKCDCEFWRARCDARWWRIHDGIAWGGGFGEMPTRTDNG